MDPSLTAEDDPADDRKPDVRKRVRGALIDIAPILCFTLSFAVTHRPGVAVTFALVAGVGAGIYRLVRRERLWRTLGVLGVVGVGSVLAALTQEAANFFLPSLALNSAAAVATPVLLAFGWPPLGLMTGIVTGEGTRWRRCPIRRRAFTRANLALLATNLVLLSVEVPLFLGGHTVTLGFTTAAGPFVHAVGALVAWRIYRRTTGDHRCVPATDRCDAHATSSDPVSAQGSPF